MELLLALLLGAGIGWSIDKPSVVIAPPIPCKVALPEKPAFDFDSVPKDATILEYTQSLHVDRIQRRQYESELEAVVKTCQ